MLSARRPRFGRLRTRRPRFRVGVLRARLVDADADRVLIVRSDALDVETVEVHALVRR